MQAREIASPTSLAEGDIPTHTYSADVAVVGLQHANRIAGRLGRVAAAIHAAAPDAGGTARQVRWGAAAAEGVGGVASPLLHKSDVREAANLRCFMSVTLNRGFLCALRDT